jgi:hypothetical protein
MNLLKFKGKAPEMIKIAIAAGVVDTFFDSGNDYEPVWFDSTLLQEIYGDQIFCNVDGQKDFVWLSQAISGTCLDDMKDFIKGESYIESRYLQSAEGEDLVDSYGFSPDLPYVSGFGVDQIFDFSPLSDVRWNKNAYVGNAFALPEYYDFPYISEIYFDTANPYHWKIKDCHYRYYEEQAVGLNDISFAKLTYNDFSYTAACTTSGLAYNTCNTAYGEWEFDLTKVSGTSTIYFNWIADRVGGAVSFIGYQLVIGGSENMTLRRATNGGVVTLWSTAAAYFPLTGKTRIKITRSVSGEFTSYIKGGSFGNDYVLIDVSGGSGTNPVTDNVVTTCDFNVLDFDVGNEISRFSINGVYEDFNDYTQTTGVYDLSDNLESSDELLLYQTGYGLNCTSNGVTYLPNTAAYGVQEFALCKTTGTNIKMNFINDSTTLEQNGYTVQFTSDNRVRIREFTAGVGSTIMATVVSYIDDDICYYIKVARNSVVDEFVTGAIGTFALYIKGGAFGDSYVLVDVTGGSGTNPATDNTHTTSAYSLLDYDAGDKLESYFIDSVQVDTRDFTDTTATSTVVSSQIDPELTQIKTYITLLPPTFEYYINEQ